MKEFQPEVDLKLEEKLSDKKFKKEGPGISSIMVLFFKYTVLILIFLLLFFVADHLYYKDRVYPGVMIENNKVGGKALPEIREYLEKEFEMMSGQKQIHFYRGDGKKDSLMALSFADVGIEPLWEHVLRDVQRLGRIEVIGNIKIGSPLERLNIYTGIADIYNFPVKITFDNELTENVFDKIDELIYEEPKNAAVALKADGSLIIKNDEPGLELNRQKTREAIMLATRHLAWARNSGMLFRVEIETQPVEAAIRVSDVEKFRFDNIKASFITSLGNSDDNRRHNIKLAAEKVHNTFLMPGAVFSFNQVVGRADSAAGYLESLVIIDGDFTAGVGGGICQVSTTLFNAAANAGMEIKERHLHSKPVSYVAEGADATISYPGKDLKIGNNLGNPVIIGVVIDKNTVTVSIHGK